MAGIYGNSVLTIFASRALTSEEGFLHSRQPYDPGSLSFRLPFKLPGNQGLGTVILGRNATAVGENRLQGRAWAFQERIMANRILDFGGAATSLTWWEPDRECEVQDGGPLSHARSWSSTDKIRARDHWLQYDFAYAENIPDSHFMQDWASRVSEYSALDVTVPTDRILAISSVAEKAAKLTKKTYLAGLWEQHLPWSLMWSMSDRKTRELRPTLYQGPSWSWLGIYGQVHSYFPSYLQDQEAGVECEVLGYEVDPLFVQAPFGSLRSASLVIRARARKARWVRSDMAKVGCDYDYLAYHPHEYPAPVCLSDSDDIGLLQQPLDPLTDPIYTPKTLLPARIYPDALEQEFAVSIPEGGQRHLDVILIKLFRDGDEVLGLVVREPKEGVSQRLGIFTTRKGQNHQYATDSRDHEISKAEDDGNSSENVETASLHEPMDFMSEVNRLGSALEGQLVSRVKEQEQQRLEEAERDDLVAWFDAKDCPDQVFVLI